MKQYEAVIQTLEALGGVATLGQLNQEVFKIADCEWKTRTRFASIRRIVQTNKEIYKVQRGLYALVKCKKQLESSGSFRQPMRTRIQRKSNHSRMVIIKGCC